MILMDEKEIQVNVDGLKTSFLKFGRGRLIYLLHGWGSSKEKLLPLGKALARGGWQVVIPDWPGFGSSAEPSKPWGVQDYANFFRKFHDQLSPGSKIVYFGHSFGGRVALKLGAGNSREISGFVLCGSAGLSRGRLFKRVLFGLSAKIGRRLFGDCSLFRRLLYKIAREHDYEKSSSLMKETFKRVVGENLRPCLAKIRQPVLILWGSDDRETRLKDAHVIVREVTGSKLKVFKGRGHLLPYREPEKVAAAVTDWGKNLISISI